MTAAERATRDIFFLGLALLLGYAAMRSKR